MTHRSLQLLPLATVFCLLAACSSGSNDSTGTQTTSPSATPPTLRVPGVLPGSGASTALKTPLPGGITPTFDYTVITEVAMGEGRTSVALQTPLEAREALERLTEQFTDAGLVNTGIGEQRKRKTNELTAYAITFSGAPDADDVGGVTAIAHADKDEDGLTMLMLLVRQP